jgi:epoxide hydrolase-like predicted phosphatase
MSDQGPEARTPPAGQIHAVISDFGGVLTSPLINSFLAYQEHSGVPLEALGTAMARLSERDGVHPLVELETGRLPEAEFLDALSHQLTEQLGRPVEMTGFGERYFAGLEPNARLIEYMRNLRGRGYRMAICTNNVREWASLWRAMLPVEEIFDVVVDSGFVGLRKPEPEIYLLTLERLGVEAGQALFVDDIEANCDAARALGMATVWFRETEQAIAEIEARLAGDTPASGDGASPDGGEGPSNRAASPDGGG